jgi:hypothetical protein
MMHTFFCPWFQRVKSNIFVILFVRVIIYVVIALANALECQSYSIA